MDQVDAQNADGLLLQDRLAIEQADMQDDLGRLGAGIGLKADAHPAVPVVLARVALGGDSVGEDEEPRGLAALGGEAFVHQAVFVVEHGLDALAADVAAGGAVDGVGDGHVVGRDALGDRAGRAADPEKPARHFLARADLGEGAVLRVVQVDLDGLLVRVQPWFHCASVPSGVAVRQDDSLKRQGSESGRSEIFDHDSAARSHWPGLDSGRLIAKLDRQQ